MDMNETTADAVAEEARAQREFEERMLGIIVRQQDLIIQQAETIGRAIAALVTERAPSRSFRDEIEDLFTAIMSIQPDDLKHAADTARAALMLFKHACAEGGGVAGVAS